MLQIVAEVLANQNLEKQSDMRKPVKREGQVRELPGNSALKYVGLDGTFKRGRVGAVVNIPLLSSTHTFKPLASRALVPKLTISGSSFPLASVFSIASCLRR